MFCPKCGKEIADDAAFCQSCGLNLQKVRQLAGNKQIINEVLSVNYSSLPVVKEPGGIEYAGFWLRFAAALLDGLIVGFVVYSIYFIFAIYATLSNSGLNDTLAVVMFYILSISIGWVYNAAMESSFNQGSLGKMIVGIKVTDLKGQKISFARATGRHFGKYLSGITLYVGYILAGVTVNKQALHDMMAGCLVVTKSSFNDIKDNY